MKELRVAGYGLRVTGFALRVVWCALRHLQSKLIVKK
jgi:hypothetical protein